MQYSSYRILFFNLNLTKAQRIVSKNKVILDLIGQKWLVVNVPMFVLCNEKYAGSQMTLDQTRTSPLHGSSFATVSLNCTYCVPCDVTTYN
jgi:hypothetical protein